jgi:hypothetical protein
MTESKGRANTKQPFLFDIAMELANFSRRVANRLIGPRDVAATWTAASGGGSADLRVLAKN